LTSRLHWKLMAIIFVVIAFIILTVWLVIDYLAADYFMTLMDEYNISPEPVHDMFVAAIHRYLIWASVAATALAVFLSFIMVKRVLGPLTAMTQLTRDISAGNYDVDIPVRSMDEVGQLAEAFNRMTASLKKIEKLRRGMMVDVAHELRTPLTNIQGYLEALLDGVVPGSKKTYTLLHEETLRLARLVEDILQLAKADAAVSSLQPSVFDFRVLINRTLDSFRMEFEKKDISVEVLSDTDTLMLRADEAKITQVVQNLVHNAIQYTPEDGKVCITLNSTPSDVKTVFANSGGRIDSTDLPYIFERFYRGEKSRSREHGGAGIGLAIVKELVEAHGGSVGADIRSGQTEIWFRLPGARNLTQH
jgi:two-component system sensor histidine kinase BaeS